MKKHIKLVALILVMTILFAVPAQAQGLEPRASSYFMSSNVYLNKTSTYNFEAWFRVSANDIMDEVGASSIAIQRSSDGENWTTMGTFSKATYPQFIDRNTSVHAACLLYTGTPGYYYRAKITLYAKDSSGTGEMVRYTSKMLL